MQETHSISAASTILSNPIEYLKGVGPLRAEMLKKDLSLFTFKDLLEFYPYRHLDKTQVSPITGITPQTEYIQVAGRITNIEVTGEGHRKRMTAVLKDATGFLELTWFQGINWLQKSLIPGNEYLVFGKAGFFMSTPQITHPEIEPFTRDKADGKPFLEPVYSSTEKLKSRGLGGRAIGKLTAHLLGLLTEKDVPECLPEEIIEQQKFVSRLTAFNHIHFPPDAEAYRKALERLKFEEFFIAQVRMGMVKTNRHRFSQGVVFGQVGELFHTFYHKYLPFSLTGAQKRVLKEIRNDCAHGRQMNRLLQGDVGSGKTIVALLSMLLALDNGFQACMMAPTEILAQQHYATVSDLLRDMPIEVRLLTGSTGTKLRREILQLTEEGTVHILIGTHALIEETVKFRNLGFGIVDEQHRFGVAQRARLWAKAVVPPHILIMTATPIPRTLAMTLYGDLDYSIMDELPPGRQPIKTVHRHDTNRPQIMDFIKSEIHLGRQAYIIFPLIEESEKMDYENLMKGYEEVKAFFPEPKYYISMVHGRQKPEVKATNMRRFVEHDTQIMVSTTVIEVGVNVPNASVMVIESAEKFGLSQLHQLRGRVGRGSEQSFCILLTGPKLTNEAKQRLITMCATNDGFKIAEKDLEIRGPGEIEGTRQSGELNFKLASIVQDKQWLQLAKEWSDNILKEDPELSDTKHSRLKEFLLSQKRKTAWSKIS